MDALMGPTGKLGLEMGGTIGLPGVVAIFKTKALTTKDTKAHKEKCGPATFM
jgi:hypothetical protein